MCGARSNRILVLTGEDKPHSDTEIAARGCRTARATGALLVAILALAACQKSAAERNDADAPADPAGYLPPPTLLAATRDASGGLAFSGEAPASTEVRLRDPAGAAFSATANDDGNWSMQLPPSDAPRMFAFEGEISGRVLHGEGAIIALPAPAPVAVLARACYGALTIGASPGPLRIVAVDYDGAGGGSVSGVAAARSPVRLVLDGQPVGIGQADDQGRFAVLDVNARKPFGQGAHIVRVEGPSSAVQGQLTVSRAKDLGGDVFRAVREASAWRTDWRIPGGGVQTTLVFDAETAASPPAPGAAKP